MAATPRDQAGRRYLAIVKPYNDVLDALERAIDASKRPPRHTRWPPPPRPTRRARSWR